MAPSSSSSPEGAIPSRPLSGADSFWLRMDDPTNLMMINGVLLFDAPLELARVREVFRTRVLPIPRFRQRVLVPRFGTARWQDYPAFDLEEHVVREHLPAPGDEESLRRVVGEKMSQPLSFDRPLWMFHLIENYRGGSALIARFHHCMGDGLGLMMVLLAMTDLEPDAQPEDTSNPFVKLFRVGDGQIENVRRHIDEIMPEGLRLLLKPTEVLRSLGTLQRSGASVVALARLVLRSPDAKTPFNARLDIAKRAAWSAPLSFEMVRDVSARLGATVNDVLLAAMSGALRHYLVERGGAACCRDFRATVPVNLRTLDHLRALGNEFGLVYLTLPVEVADPAARLAEVQRRIGKLKRSAEAPVSYQALRVMGRLPRVAQRLLVRLFASKATAVVTNVPGPNRTLYLAGRPIRDMLFWVPRSGRLSLGVSLFSYAGTVRMGLATDAALIPDPQRIADVFTDEFAALRRLASG